LEPKRDAGVETAPEPLARFGKNAKHFVPGEKSMREGKLVLASGRLMPMLWSAHLPDEREKRPAWRLARLHLPRWFQRKETTLFQRCLAVHIYHTSKQSSLR
jgi:hypothetical protein